MILLFRKKKREKEIEREKVKRREKNGTKRRNTKKWEDKHVNIYISRRSIKNWPKEERGNKERGNFDPPV